MKILFEAPQFRVVDQKNIKNTSRGAVWVQKHCSKSLLFKHVANFNVAAETSSKKKDFYIERKRFTEHFY